MGWGRGLMLGAEYVPTSAAGDNYNSRVSLPPKPGFKPQSLAIPCACNQFNFYQSARVWKGNR